MKLGPLKLFISYNHKDKSYLNELTKHLVTLKRNGVLADWSDKELIAGDKLHEDISRNLAESDLVAFLVSVDFLNSWYCFEKELIPTLKRINTESPRIIPIIVRACSWQETPLGQYCAATQDGEPVAGYADQDAAWVEVVRSIERAANEYIKSGEPNHTPSINHLVRLNPQFTEKLEDTEIQFQHKYKDHVMLEDIFVYPDLKNLKQEYEEFDKTISSSTFANVTTLPHRILILGSEQDGKTSLAKTLFNAFYKDGNVPLLWEGSDIKTTDVKQNLNKLLPSQYSELSLEDFLSQIGKKIIIIDDLHKIKLNMRYQRIFFDNLNEIADKIILLADSSIKYDEEQFLKLSDYAPYEILPFGHARRGELIDKWNSIGRIQTIDIKELQHHSDEFIRHVDSIIRKNILPPKPLYVLTVIQLLDTAKPADYSLTSYGYCYQSLIQAALKRANIAVPDFDPYINYLSELAYFVFRHGSESIEVGELDIFKTEYARKYLIKSHEDVISVLSGAGIIRINEASLRFGYRYIFYFYVAKYLADHLDTEECKVEIKGLFDRLHAEKNANVLIFLLHHTKDKGIIDEILTLASRIFTNTSIAKLDLSDTKYLTEYLASLQKLVIEQRNVDQERKRHLEIQDQFEEQDGQDNDNETPESTRYILSEINQSVRLVEIIGQILRNRYGSLTKVQLTNLTLSAYSSGLKFLKFFLDSTRDNQNVILNYLQGLFKKNTRLGDKQISNEARKIFLMICYGVSYSVIKKIANSVGSNKLVAIFEEISRSHNDIPTYQLINIAIKMEFGKSIPRAEVERLYKDLEDNPIARRLLQEIIIQHLYLNYVDYKDRQWISEKLALPMASQRQLQSKPDRKK